jgi:hypothetical protein
MLLVAVWHNLTDVSDVFTASIIRTIATMYIHAVKPNIIAGHVQFQSILHTCQSKDLFFDYLPLLILLVNDKDEIRQAATMASISR